MVTDQRMIAADTLIEMASGVRFPYSAALTKEELEERTRPAREWAPLCAVDALVDLALVSSRESFVARTHYCEDFLLASGECEVCWLASK